MDLATHLAELVKVSSITGHEQGVARLLLADWADLVHEASVDRLGSYIGLRRGGGSESSLASLPLPQQPGIGSRGAGRPPGPPRVVAAAHIDSIGGMVTAIEPGGFLRFTTVGGVDRRLLMAQEVEVHGSRTLHGVVGSKPPHLTAPEERGRLSRLDELYIDTGLPESDVRSLVHLGAPVLPRYRFVRLANDRVAGRYMDNRASLAALRVALEELRGLHHTADFYAVGTVGEEFGGMPGAVTTTYSIKPDIAIAVDVTFGKHPGSDEDSFALGEGPAIGVGPNASPKLVKLMRRAADELGIAYALEVLPGHSGTDAHAMQVVRGGVATGILSIPIRYMHTPVETVDLSDIRAAGKLLAHLITLVDLAALEEITCY